MSHLAPSFLVINNHLLSLQNETRSGTAKAETIQEPLSRFAEDLVSLYACSNNKALRKRLQWINDLHHQFSQLQIPGELSSIRGQIERSFNKLFSIMRKSIPQIPRIDETSSIKNVIRNFRDRVQVLEKAVVGFQDTRADITPIINALRSLNGTLGQVQNRKASIKEREEMNVLRDQCLTLCKDLQRNKEIANQLQILTSNFENLNQGRPIRVTREAKLNLSDIEHNLNNALRNKQPPSQALTALEDYMLTNPKKMFLAYETVTRTRAELQQYHPHIRELDAFIEKHCVRYCEAKSKGLRKGANIKTSSGRSINLNKALSSLTSINLDRARDPRFIKNLMKIVKKQLMQILTHAKHNLEPLYIAQILDTLRSFQQEITEKIPHHKRIKACTELIKAATKKLGHFVRLQQQAA